MELRLEQGDYVPNGAGGFQRLEGAEALERLSALFRREAEGWVEVDFTAAAPVLTGQVSLSLKLYQLLWLGLHFGLRALSTYVNHRNRHKQQREAV